MDDFKYEPFHWFRINKTKIMCLETGHEISLSHSSRKFYGIHSTAFQGLIKVLITKDENEAQDEFEKFITQLKVINIEEKQEDKKEVIEEEANKVNRE